MKMTKKQLRQVEWMLMTGIMLFTCIRGVAWGIQFDANVFKFLAWLSCAPTIIGALSTEMSAKMKKIGPAIPPLLSLMIDILMACICAGCGWFGYAALVGIAGVCSYATYMDLESDKEITNND
jgi:hypothetical protein